MVKKRGLGKSLDALLVGSYTETKDTSNTHDNLVQLPVDLMQRGKYQPRRAINPEGLEELANSIKAQGIIQPIVVRKISAQKYEILAGERRWRAAQLAGFIEVPVIIRDVPDDAAVAIALIENIQRESLNPIEESVALQRLLEEFSMTHQQVADAVGKSRATVTNLLRLLALNERVKQLLENGDLEMGHARALLSLTEELQMEAANQIVAHGLSVRETEELVRKMQMPANLKKQSDERPIDPDVKRLQHELAQLIRLPVSIQCSPRGKGKITIEYKNIAELDKILHYFKMD